jgi:hypothetical protein
MTEHWHESFVCVCACLLTRACACRLSRERWAALRDDRPAVAAASQAGRPTASVACVPRHCLTDAHDGPRLTDDGAARAHAACLLGKPGPVCVACAAGTTGWPCRCPLSKNVRPPARRCQWWSSTQEQPQEGPRRVPAPPAACVLLLRWLTATAAGPARAASASCGKSARRDSQTDRQPARQTDGAHGPAQAAARCALGCRVAPRCVDGGLTATVGRACSLQPNSGHGGRARRRAARARGGPDKGRGGTRT